MHELIFIKLGGSLITDKRRQAVARREVIQRLAREIGESAERNPHLRILLGHGSGSFGHWEANRYGTRDGVTEDKEWRGFARVSAAALRLNRLVTEIFTDEGVPVLSLQPSAAALAHEGSILRYETEPIKRALEHRLIPIVFGDVMFDTVRGGTILSTEDIFVYLAQVFKPSWIVLLGNTPGVLRGKGAVIPLITPELYAQVQAHLQGSAYTDVTGGMVNKVKQMLALTQRQPDVRIRIMSGHQAGLLTQTLRAPDQATEGTLITTMTQGGRAS